MRKETDSIKIKEKQTNASDSVGKSAYGLLHNDENWLFKSVVPRPVASASLETLLELHILRSHT